MAWLLLLIECSAHRQQVLLLMLIWSYQWQCLWGCWKGCYEPPLSPWHNWCIWCCWDHIFHWNLRTLQKTYMSVLTWLNLYMEVIINSMACIKLQFQSPKFWADLEISVQLKDPIHKMQSSFQSLDTGQLQKLHYFKTFFIEFHKCQAHLIACLHAHIHSM